MIRLIKQNSNKDPVDVFDLRPQSLKRPLIIMETGIWTGEQNIQFETLMLYHNMKNSDDNKKVKYVVE